MKKKLLILPFCNDICYFENFKKVINDLGDLDWIIYEKDKSLKDKCSIKIFDNYIKLPFIGEGTFSFLHHVVNNYDNLHDITILTKAHGILDMPKSCGKVKFSGIKPDLFKKILIDDNFLIKYHPLAHPQVLNFIDWYGRTGEKGGDRNLIKKECQAFDENFFLKYEMKSIEGRVWFERINNNFKKNSFDINFDKYWDSFPAIKRKIFCQSGWLVGHEKSGSSLQIKKWMDIFFDDYRPEETIDFSQIVDTEGTFSVKKELIRCHSLEKWKTFYYNYIDIMIKAKKFREKRNELHVVPLRDLVAEFIALLWYETEKKYYKKI